MFLTDFMKSFKILSLSIFPMVLLSSQTFGGVVVSGPTTTLDGSLQITEDITFTMTTGMSGSGIAFVMDSAVSSPDGTINGSLMGGLGLSLSINGSAPVFYSGYMNDDSFSQLDITMDDSYFGTSDFITFSASDTLTLKAGTYLLYGGSAFNPLASQTFTGSMFVADSVGNKISNTVAVPEPSSLLLSALGLGLLVFRRQVKPVSA